MKNLCPKQIDFADSEFISFEFSSDQSLILYIKSCREHVLKIKFTNVIQFSYKLGFQISNLFEINEHTSFLEEALSREFKYPYPENQFREYHVEDIYDFPFIQLVADSVSLVEC